MEAKALEKRVRNGVVVTEDDYKRSVMKLEPRSKNPSFRLLNTKDFKAAQANNAILPPKSRRWRKA